MRAHVCGWLVVLLVASGGELYAQLGLPAKPKPPSKVVEPVKTDPNAPPPSLAIKIPDEPRGIDPATLLPKKLATRATVRFEDKLLRDVVEWLQKDQKLDIQLDLKALEEAAYDLYEPLNTALDNEPVYVLLDRLRARGLDWYSEDGIVHLTTKSANENHQYTVSYLLSALLDAGYVGGEELIALLESTIEPTTWKSNGGQGSAVILGDVMFIRQTSNVHLKVAGLLAALKTHGRRTFILDPPEHTKLRELLEKPARVKLVNIPFHKAMTELSKTLKTPILTDQRSLEEAAFDDRTLVTFEAQDLKTRHLLRGLTANLGLAPVVRDGALWITTKTALENMLVTAVYDVRDLCRDSSEGEALISTIQEQAEPTAWKANGGQGDVTMAKDGVMVICQPEEIHDEVLRLLENYRSALRNSKPRPAPAKNTKPVKVYYRIPQTMAKELVEFIPAEIKPETWQAKGKPEATGTIKLLSSVPEITSVKGEAMKEEDKSEPKSMLVIPQAVLIISQTEDVHQEIEQLILNLEHGTSLLQPDAIKPGLNGFGGGGLGGLGGGGPGAFGGSGGGGFGGGFFSVPSR